MMNEPGRERRIRNAEQQVEDERWQCQTCSAPNTEENGEYCSACAIYWQDVGELDDGMLRDMPLLAND